MTSINNVAFQQPTLKSYQFSPPQQSQPTRPSGGDTSSTLVSLSEQVKRMSTPEGKAEMKSLSEQIRDAHATSDTSTKEGRAKLRADVETMIDDYRSNQKKSAATGSDPASQGQSLQQAAVASLAQGNAVASYMTMSLMR